MKFLKISATLLAMSTIQACDEGKGVKDDDESSSSSEGADDQSTATQQETASNNSGNTGTAGDGGAILPPGDTTEFLCGAPISATGVFEKGIANSGTVAISIQDPIAKSVSVSLTGSGFSGSLTESLDGSESNIVIPIAHDGSGEGGTSVTLTVSSPDIAGTCQVLARIQTVSERMLGLYAGEYAEDGTSGICARKSDNSVHCWGTTANFHGGTATAGLLHEINDLPVNLNEVLPLEGHGFAQTADGRLYSWGKFDAGNRALGRTGTSGFNAAVEVTGWSVERKVKQVSGDHTDACALLDNNELWCWGENSHGEFGNNVTDVDGKPVGSDTPIGPVETDVTRVFAGGSNHCIQKTDNKLYCAGNGGEGQLGNETFDDSLVYVEVNGMTDVSHLSLVGNINIRALCALKTDASVWCWGKNNFGQVGNGANDNVNDPVEVMTGIAYLRSGLEHSCAIKSADKSVWCWGGNDQGQLGNGTTVNSSTPVQVTGITNATKVELGERHSCALNEAGEVWCWGLNSNHRLGDSTTNNRTSPVRFGGGSSPVADGLRVYRHDSCMLSGIDVYCSGRHSGNNPGSVIISY